MRDPPRGFSGCCSLSGAEEEVSQVAGGRRVPSWGCVCGLSQQSSRQRRSRASYRDEVSPSPLHANQPPSEELYTEPAKSKRCFWMSLRHFLSSPSPSHGILSGFRCELPKVSISKLSGRARLYTKPRGNQHILATPRVSRVNSQPPFPKRSFKCQQTP